MHACTRSYTCKHCITYTDACIRTYAQMYTYKHVHKDTRAHIRDAWMHVYTNLNKLVLVYRRSRVTVNTWVTFAIVAEMQPYMQRSDLPQEEHDQAAAEHLNLHVTKATSCGRS